MCVCVLGSSRVDGSERSSWSSRSAGEWINSSCCVFGYHVSRYCIHMIRLTSSEYRRSHQSIIWIMCVCVCVCQGIRGVDGVQGSKGNMVSTADLRCLKGVMN